MPSASRSHFTPCDLSAPHSSACIPWQCGHGTWNRQRSLAWNAASMRDRSRVVGVLVFSRLRLANVVCLASASWHGSPSPSTSVG